MYNNIHTYLEYAVVTITEAVGITSRDEIKVSVISVVLDSIHDVVESIGEKTAVVVPSMIAVASTILDHAVAEEFIVGIGANVVPKRVAIFEIVDSSSVVAESNCVLVSCTVVVGDSATDGTACVVSGD